MSPLRIPRLAQTTPRLPDTSPIPITMPNLKASAAPLRRPTTASAAPAFVTSLASRLINSCRLAGKPEHQRRVRESRRVLRKIRSFTGEGSAGRVFAYLRTIDPFVFEEVVLSALEDAGGVVLRNRRYTGDGGLDGRCWFPWAGWRTIAIQAKRYDAAVTPSDVAAFAGLVRQDGHAGGYFVHCGRSGPLTYEALRGQPVQLLSGTRMLSLLLRAYL